jgi:hypothetical protein
MSKAGKGVTVKRAGIDPYVSTLLEKIPRGEHGKNDLRPSLCSRIEKQSMISISSRAVEASKIHGRIDDPQH